MYDAAKAVLNERRISEYVTCGEVSAAVCSKSGKIYTGVCIDTCSTLGICAERNAIFNMITNGEQEIMQTKPFPDVDVPNVYDRELEAISLYSRNSDNSWKEEEFMCFQMTLTEDAIPALIQHMYAHHTRMISLYDLRLIAPDVCESLYNIEEDWSIDNYSEKEQKNLYVGLRGDIVERVFDLIYDSGFFTI